jgi:hypothetical protein
MQTLNEALPPGTAVADGQLQTVFDLLYGKLEEKLKALPPDEVETRPERQTNEILEEILTRVRAIEQREFSTSAGEPTDAEILRRRLDLRAKELEKQLSDAFPQYICDVRILGNDFRITVTDIYSEKSINRVFPFNASIQAIVRKVSRILTDSETSGEKTAEPAVGMDS